MLSALNHFVSLSRESQSAPKVKPESTDKKEEQDGAVSEEVGEKVYQVKMAWVRKLYRDLATDEQVTEYLKSPNSGYNLQASRWNTLPKDLNDTSELIPPLIEIISHTIAHFYPPESLQPGVSRSVVDSHDLRLAHDDGKHASKPSISIKATGPSFEVPEKVEQCDDSLGYTNVAAVFEVMTEQSKGGRLDQAARLASPCRQIVVQQPNRLYTRSLMVTESHARLVHFDRSGAYVSPLIDIHKERAVFVRLILGLSSPDEAVLGLDTSVQWMVDQATGRKVSGTVQVAQYDEETKSSTTVTYDLNMQEPPLSRTSIRGHGTVCWNATDPATQDAVIIKDAWRTDTHASEGEHLRAALGIPGVVQMLAYQDFCAGTSDYRPPDFTGPSGFHNRMKLRVVMRKYGPSIWQFNTRLELLRALLDAIIGHKELFDRGILHRDVSVHNILFGPPDALEGSRGCLIDLDAAVRTVDGVSPIPASPYTGTRLYQSVSVLRSLTAVHPVPQDYMDDLESFFYVLCHIVFMFTAPGIQQSEVPLFLRYWLDDKLDVLATIKCGCLLWPIPDWQIATYWGKAVVKLVKEFREVLETIVEKKGKIREDRETDDNQKMQGYVDLSKDVDVYFDQVKAAFVKAIGRLEQEGLSPEEQDMRPELSTTTPRAPLSSARSCNAAPLVRKKRPEHGSEDDEILVKRPRKDADCGQHVATATSPRSITKSGMTTVQNLSPAGRSSADNSARRGSGHAE